MSSRTWAHKFLIVHSFSGNIWVPWSSTPSFTTSLYISSLATRQNVSFIRFRRMQCTTGVFTIPNESWKHFSCIGSATQPHHFRMCFGTVLTTGPLARILHIMSITHFIPLLVTFKWRLALHLVCCVKCQTSTVISCWENCGALRAMGDIKSLKGFCSTLWHVLITQPKYISG